MPTSPERASNVPVTIGPYRLERELGSGGIGQVWLAEQTEPVQRWIALKVIRAGFYDASTAQRLLSERQSLALMNHPAIAKVFDAGATAAGQPYFAMEYVNGLSITTYCDEKQLGVRERLKLFLEVCAGVQHAHQKAIIHRDLKPSNILVTEVDGKPAARIIDFGLAKSMAPALTAETLTQEGAFLGTPGYMSPEQASPGERDVDTRTDVYSLGAVLYELLTGLPPYDTERWKKQRLDEVLKDICDEDPVPPSARVRLSKTGDRLQGMGVRQLSRVLRNDLDWIILKALQRDRNKRYATPYELAADLRRYLNKQPVKARAATPAYRLRRYVHRNALAVAITAGGLVLLIVFAISQNLQLRRIQRERERADYVTQFMIRMFHVSDPGESRGNSITAREILDRSAGEIRTELARDPELQAELMHVMGTVYQDLGLLSRARPLLEKAVEMRRDGLGLNNVMTLQSMEALALLLDREGRLKEAEKLQREALARRRIVQGPYSPDVRKAASNLAIFLSDAGRTQEAEKLDQEALNISQRMYGSEHNDTLTSINNLAVDFVAEKRYAEAEALLSPALVSARRTLGSNHPSTLATMTNLAVVLYRTRRYAEAEKLEEETRNIQRRVLGPDHAETAGSTYNLAVVAALQGQRDKAFALLREALDHGLGPVDAGAMKDDDDLKSLRSDPRFQALVAYADNRSASKKEP